MLVAVFAERESHAAYFLEQQGISGYDAVNYISHGTTTRVLASFNQREERVLRMRFGIGMNTDHTLEEVGQQFSVARERIRQIEAKALRKLKHPLRKPKHPSRSPEADEKGKLRQGFSHGRTKRVVVEKKEVKRRRPPRYGKTAKKPPSRAAKMRLVRSDRPVSLVGPTLTRRLVLTEYRRIADVSRADLICLHLFAAVRSATALLYKSSKFHVLTGILHAPVITHCDLE